MRILFTAFEGDDNSSKILLDKIDNDDKLYLEIDFEGSEGQLKKKLQENKYDLIVSFGQAPINKDVIKIEIIGRGDREYKTNYNYEQLADELRNDYEVIVSEDAGKYLCNNIYYYGLKYIDDNNLNTKMIFIHIPLKDEISDFDRLAKKMKSAISGVAI